MSAAVDSPRAAREELSQLSDEALMARAAHGDVAAFGAIYDRHAGAVGALARRMLSGVGGEEDLVHDVFIEAWQAAREYDPRRAHVRVWLLVRARSRALDRRLRKGREHGVHHTLLVHGALAAPAIDTQIAVRQALTQLASQVRQTLELTYFEGLTAPEIAERMRVPEGTVRSRLAKGLRVLESVLSNVVMRGPRSEQS